MIRVLRCLGNRQLHALDSSVESIAARAVVRGDGRTAVLADVAAVGGGEDEFLRTMADYPFQEGVSLGPVNINYLTLKAAAVMQRLKDLNALPAPNN